MGLPNKSAGGEKRRAARHRTLLRPGRIFDTTNRFLLDCSFHDVSATGVRVRLMDDMAIPVVVMVLDVRELKSRKARIAWRKGRDVGLQFI